MADQRPSKARKTTSSALSSSSSSSSSSSPPLPPRSLNDVSNPEALRILSYLDPRAVLNTAETSPKWRKLATSDVVWRLEGATKKEEVTGVAVVGRGMDLLAKGKGWGVAKPKKVGGGGARQKGRPRTRAAAAEEEEDGRWHAWYRSVTVVARLTDTELQERWEGGESGGPVDPNYPEGSLRDAVQFYFEDQAAAEARYGRIETWDTSRITDMSCLFYDKEDFNADISRWNVGQVKDMEAMCKLLTPAAPLVLSAPRAALTSSPPLHLRNSLRGHVVQRRRVPVGRGAGQVHELHV